jgi:hypothetical protein
MGGDSQRRSVVGQAALLSTACEVLSAKGFLVRGSDFVKASGSRVEANAVALSL